MTDNQQRSIPASIAAYKPILKYLLRKYNNVLEPLAQDWQTHGDIFQYHLLRHKLYIISTPEVIPEMMVNQRNNFRKLYMAGQADASLGLVLGNGLITNNSEESWFSQRRLMQPMFHRHYLATMSDRIIQIGEQLVEQWQRTYEPEQVINIGNEMTRATLDIINSIMFSNDIPHESSTIVQAIQTAASYVARRTVSPIKLPLSIATPGQRRYMRAVKHVDNIIYRIISQRRAKPSQTVDLLDMLLQAQDADNGAHMSDKQLRDELATIISAGHDTTAHSLTWICYLLAKHPQTQTVLADQIDSVVQGCRPTVQDLANLPMLSAIINEGLRLYPAVPNVIRVAQHDTQLNGYRIDSGSQLMISIYNIHRHPAYWNQPQIFDPSRWSVERTDKRHKHAFMPFGAGPRMCLGNNLAIMETSLLLTIIMQQYQFGLAEQTKSDLEVVLTLRPKHGMYLRLLPRS